MSTPPNSPQGQPSPGVRLAMPAEAVQIAQLQRRCWAADELERRALDEISEEQMASLWLEAITRPPLAHFRVLVATQPMGDTTRVCGFAALGPSDDPDAQVTDSLVAEFCIDPLVPGMGHEDRLMHAVVDTMRADGYERATWWLASTDDERRAWLVESGWAPDGAHREVGTEDGVLRVKQVRLHTDIRP